MREKIKGGETKAEAKIVTSFDEVQDACKILEQKYSLMYKMTTSFQETKITLIAT